MDFNIRDWSDISAVSTAIQLVIIIISIIYVKRQLDENVSSNKIQLFREILCEIGVKEVRQIRKWLYETNEIKEEDLEKVSELAVAYDRISFMLLNDVKALSLFREFQGNELIYIWNKIKDRIHEIRKSRKNPDYCKHFEKLEEKLRNYSRDN
ncbi:hypothetical protein RI065_08550 [Mycoplasmatota bacterium zrk1]